MAWEDQKSNEWANPWTSRSGAPFGTASSPGSSSGASTGAGGQSDLYAFLDQIWGARGSSGSQATGYHGWPSRSGDPSGMAYAHQAFSGAGAGDFSSAMGRSAERRRRHRPGQGQGQTQGQTQTQEPPPPWDPVSSGLPEAFRDPRFQEIAQRYAPISESWREGGQHWDRDSLTSNVRRDLQRFDVRTAQDLESEVAQWGVEGLTGRQWLDDLNWLGGHLGVEQGRYAGWRDHADGYTDTRGVYGQRNIPHTFGELQDNPVFKTIAEKYVAVDPRWRDMGRNWNVEDLANWTINQLEHVRRSGKENLEREAAELGIRDFDADMWQREMQWLYQALMPSLNDARNAHFANRGVNLESPDAQRRILEAYQSGDGYPEWMRLYPITRGYEDLLQSTPMHNPAIHGENNMMISSSIPVTKLRAWNNAGLGFGL